MESRETRWSASEVKFLVSPALGAEVENWSRRWMAPDPHGVRYLVSNLYLDTVEGDVFRRNGSFGRAKYRIRRYDDSSQAFLERKLRTNAAVTKRRSAVDLDDLPLLDSFAVDRHWTDGLWFHRRIQARNLRPAWQVTYQRTARVLDTKAGPIRLTIDRGLRAGPASGFQFEPSSGTPVFGDSDGRLILELKFAKRMPDLFRDLMHDLVLTPQPVSKFRLAAGTLAYA